MSNTYCVITSCKTTAFNKPLGVTFHSCPTSDDMRNKWLLLLKNKCTILDWLKSKICSKHFEKKYFDFQRRLTENAIPTIFPQSVDRISKNDFITKTDKCLSKLSQADLIIGIQKSRIKLREPTNLDSFVNDDGKSVNNAPTEARLWLMVKKQEHLITRLMDQVAQGKKNVEILKKNLDASRISKREMEQNLETMKYIVKSLQEKHATLEEQIEILTAVETT